MKNILSVDDDPRILLCYKTMLNDRGYEVFTTTDPLKVSDLLKKHEFDLIMLDVRMPKKDGFQIFKELKEKYSQVPVLFVTAYQKSFSLNSDNMLDMWRNEFADGNTDILYKPFDMDTLYDKVDALLGEPGADEE